MRGNTLSRLKSQQKIIQKHTPKIAKRVKMAKNGLQNIIPKIIKNGRMGLRKPFIGPKTKYIACSFGNRFQFYDESNSFGWRRR